MRRHRDEGGGAAVALALMARPDGGARDAAPFCGACAPHGAAELGYTSLFWFLHRELGLSKGAAFYRKTAAELVQRFPEIVEPLRDGRLCLTSVVALSKVITPENRAEVIPRFFHRSRTEAMEVVAELKPLDAPPLREVVTSVPAASPALMFDDITSRPLDSRSGTW